MADAHKNFSTSLVATAPSPATSGTSLVVTAGEGSRFPATPFNATICPSGQDPTPANAEIVRVTGISTDTFTISRAQESSSARTVVTGDRIYAGVTAKTLTDLETVEGFTAPTLGANWSNFGGAWSTAGYYKDNQGNVRLKGLIKSTAGSDVTTIFTLPTGYRPTQDLLFMAMANGAIAQLKILATGVVAMSGAFAGTNVFVVLDGITLRAQQ